jgi:CheY-specific phosphatase CheX
MNLKTCIPTRTCDFIGLSDLMDEEYLDFHALCNAAITDIKNLVTGQRG